MSANTTIERTVNLPFYPMSTTPVSSHSGLLPRRDALRLLGLAGAAAAFAPSLLRGNTSPNDPVSSAPPSLRGAQPGFYRFSIGSWEALAISDGGMIMPTAQAGFGIGEPREKTTSVLRDSFLPTDKIQVPFTLLLVRIGSELVLVDAGAGNTFGRAGGRFLSNLAAAGVRPDQITAVIISHAHGDHVGGLVDDTTQEAVFKNAKLFISRREFDFWTRAPDLSQMNMPDSQGKQMIKLAQTYLNVFKDKWRFISPGDKLIEGVEVIDAPGHTPGHIGLLFNFGSDQLLHVADAVHHHAIEFAHPEWILCSDAQPQLAIESREKLLERAAAERLRIFGAHLPFPGLGHVRSLGSGRYEHVLEPLDVS
jgi:glyoxylase-like metal-dependent hydrolase (beta-lactamase superfamily II)